MHLQQPSNNANGLLIRRILPIRNKLNMSHKLKISLNNTEPKIYRTVIVPERFNFHQLHIVIQCVMNWNNSHLYQFNVGVAYRSDTIALEDPDEVSEGILRRRNQKFDA